MRRMVRTIMLGCVLWLLFAATALAANTIDLSVDKTRMTTADLLRVEVKVSLDDEDAVTDTIMPDFTGFRLVDQDQSSQYYTSVINFKMTSQKILTHVFLLEPSEAGVYTIGPAVIQEKNQRIKSRVSQVTVVKLEPSVANGPRSGQEALAAPLSAQEKQRPELFMRMIPERDSMRIGEQMIVTLYVYVGNVQASRMSTVKQPEFDGFLVENLEMPKTQQKRRINIGRRNYHLEPVARYLITAQQVGTRNISAFHAKLLINDGQFFGGRWLQYASEPLAIEVQPLPEQNKPEGFSNANVGRFGLQASIDRRSTELGQPVTLTVTLTGDRNMENVQLPPLPDLEGARIYPPTEDRQSWQEGLRMMGKRTAEYLIVPRRKGSLKIPSIGFTYFDTELGDYKTLRTPAYHVRVTEATAQPGTNGQALAGAKQDLFIEDDALRPLTPTAQLENASRGFASSALFLWLVIAPLGLVLLVLASDGLRRLAPRLTGGDRQIKERRVKALLAELKAAPDAEPKAFATRLVDWMLLKLELAYGLSLSGLTWDQVAVALREAGLDEAASQRVLDVFHASDMLRYAPQAVGGGQALLAKAEAAIKEVAP